LDARRGELGGGDASKLISLTAFQNAVGKMDTARVWLLVETELMNVRPRNLPRSYFECGLSKSSSERMRFILCYVYVNPDFKTLSIHTSIFKSFSFTLKCLSVDKKGQNGEKKMHFHMKMH